jgi:hypothetical protein
MILLQEGDLACNALQILSWSQFRSHEFNQRSCERRSEGRVTYQSQGSLFSTDFLRESIGRLPDWAELTDDSIESVRADLKRIFDAFPTAQSPNESQTEDDLIWSVLTRLGWTASLRNQNLTTRGRDDVPDGLLFKDAETKATASIADLNECADSFAELRILNGR